MKKRSLIPTDYVLFIHNITAAERTQVCCVTNKKSTLNKTGLKLTKNL